MPRFPAEGAVALSFLLAIRRTKLNRAASFIMVLGVLKVRDTFRQLETQGIDYSARAMEKTANTQYKIASDTDG
jgi:hypothetical protein